MGSPTHNKQLLELINIVSHDVDSAASKDDLLAAIQKVRDFKGPLTFDNTTPGILAGVGAAFLLLAIWLMLWAPQSARHWLISFTGIDYTIIQIVPAVFGVVSTLSALTYIGSRSSMLPDLSRRIARMSSYLTLGLKHIRKNPEKILSRLMAEFADYHRGNYSREIELSLGGTYKGTLHLIPYVFHHLHYVNKRVVVERVSDGKGGYRTVVKTVYDHFDRYSIVLRFPWVRGISVRADGMSDIDRKTGWETTSTDFNSYFTLTGRTEMDCAKFAKPTTVLTLLELWRYLASANLEFSDDGNLCVSFGNDNLLDYSLKTSLADPDAFYEEIAKGVQLPHLTTVLQLVHRLAEQHDDNFSPIPTPASIQEQ